MSDKEKGIREHIDEVLDSGKVSPFFYFLYSKYMTKEQIDKAIELGKYLDKLYEFEGERFTPDQVDKAIDIGEHLDILWGVVHSLTEEQEDRIMSKLNIKNGRKVSLEVKVAEKLIEIADRLIIEGL
jgi:vacuolar-type H+-ATPase subunit B/Vma2